jgi:hypothetical protein
VKNLESMAKDVWAKKHLGEKKEILVDMVLSFDHKGKQVKFLQAVSNLQSTIKADNMAAQLALNDTDAVIS